MYRALVIAALWRSSTALLVGDNSPCMTNCGNVIDSTTNDMIVCDEAAYSSTSNGQVYKACVGCESTSSYSHQSSSDLNSMLYNMRYATNVCLYESTANPCITSFACANIKNAIQYGNLSTSSSIYGYCDLWTDYNLDKCHNCLLSSSNGNYLSNYISILDGACRLRLEPGATLPLQGNIFSTDVVNVTDPTPTATFAPPGITGPLDSGAIAGVVIGGLVVLLGVAGCGIVLNGKRRRKAYLRRREHATKNWPGAQGGGGGGGEMFETPISQRPLRGAGWEDSPVSAATQTTFPPYFSPYASQYNSPVSGGGVEGSGPGVGGWPVVEKGMYGNTNHTDGNNGNNGYGNGNGNGNGYGNIGVAISPDREIAAAAASPWGDDKKGKEKEADGFELQEGVNSAGGYDFPIPPPPPRMPAQAPVLSHPGYGRRGPALQPQSRGLQADDGMPGNAL
ncbi:hypothetical protein GGR54DRAFT_436939 [Hypoxylon sp. NC1633]|nr:hypothetical protein GGR54DRAFT_436939 [Hypoxylon sp. NC1633]